MKQLLLKNMIQLESHENRYMREKVTPIVRLTLLPGINWSSSISEVAGCGYSFWSEQ